jgi:hypothetical protein
MNAIDFDTFATINPEQLADVAGGFDVTRMVDNANRSAVVIESGSTPGGESGGFCCGM